MTAKFYQALAVSIVLFHLKGYVYSKVIGPILKRERYFMIVGISHRV